MDWFKRKKAKAAPVEDRLAFSAEQDFSFVQLDKSIHDVKFETKPTTFFKDAFKRFCKSKSSVTAAIILGVLILMAIIVPIADGNDITRSNNITESHYLPPKWFPSGTGWMDGTEWVSGVTLDPATMRPVQTDGSVYRDEAIVSDIEVTEDYLSQKSEGVLKYGQGGAVTFFPTKEGFDVDYMSDVFTYLPINETEVAYSFEKEATETLGGNPLWTPVLYVQDDAGQWVVGHELQEAGRSYEDCSFDLGEILADVVTEATDFRFGVHVEGEEGKQTSLYLKSAVLEVNGAVNENVSFTDATALLGGRSSSWTLVSQGAQTGIYRSKMLLGSFRYDKYEAAFGEDTASFTSTEVDTFVKRGWMTYTWGDVSSFALTEAGEKYCPIRTVDKESTSSWGDVSSRSLTGTRSRYRYLYYQGYIAECTDQIYYLFGTNAQGKDFFKVVFSGLLTSLELGFLCAIINITVGVVWGSISGYFGGWVDLLMERVAEILGGVPFIVMMTLIVLLLGSNFWTFLLGLCLTGWMGMAATTRSQFYRFKGREYVLASRTLGASDARLIFRHILPNGIGIIITSGVLMIPSVIFSEATISYLLPGVLAFQGSQSFGVTLSTAQQSITTYPYMIISASIVMAVIMICFNLFGNGLRDAFNPSMKGAQD